MWERLREWASPYLIKWFVHPYEKLTEAELAAQKQFLEKLDVRDRRKTDGLPIIIALVGLVGSGKSVVAKHLAEVLGATIVCADDIRVELRKQGASYDRAWLIAENAAIDALRCGCNVIMDSDFIDWRKRASLLVKAREWRGWWSQQGVDLGYVRVYCDVDVVVGRIISSAYINSPDDFFGSASSNWVGSAQSRGAAVKLREMWRRTPHHYCWVSDGGGKWVLKNLPFFIPWTVDTTKGGDLEVGCNILRWKSFPC